MCGSLELQGGNACARDLGVPSLWMTSKATRFNEISKEREEAFGLCGHSSCMWPQMWPSLGMLSGFGWTHRRGAGAVISQEID